MKSCPVIRVVWHGKSSQKGIRGKISIFPVTHGKINSVYFDQVMLFELFSELPVFVQNIHASLLPDLDPIIRQPRPQSFYPFCPLSPNLTPNLSIPFSPFSPNLAPSFFLSTPVLYPLQLSISRPMVPLSVSLMKGSGTIDLYLLLTLSTNEDARSQRHPWHQHRDHDHP